MFETWRADYRRHERSILNPTFWAVRNYRFGVRLDKRKFKPLHWFLNKIYAFNLFIIQITSGIRLYKETKIGADLHLIHPGNILIDPRAIIGDRCGIQHDVTIGRNFGNGSPKIGNDVYIGAGAKILGGIVIGDGVTIAANSLVIKDVPAGYTAMGVPARAWPLPRRNGDEENVTTDKPED
jgi:serine O-acetyltransferase